MHTECSHASGELAAKRQPYISRQFKLWRWGSTRGTMLAETQQNCRQKCITAVFLQRGRDVSLWHAQSKPHRARTSGQEHVVAAHQLS